MECKTIRNNINCRFMSKKGCSYKNGFCHEIVDKCQGCNRSIEFPSGKYCKSYPEPKLRWENGNCNLATHTKRDQSKSKVKINPLKASKRAAR